MRRPAVPVLLCAVALGACGSGDDAEGPDYRLVTPPRYAGAEPVATPAGGREPRPSAADARRLRSVLEGWSDAVRRGRPGRASRYFALPALVAQPSSGPLVIRSAQVVERFNAALPCGARLLGTRARGRYVVGTFRLVDAEGRRCPSTGRVEVGFVFGDPDRPQRFTEWWQATAVGEAPGPPTRPAAPVADDSTFG